MCLATYDLWLTTYDEDKMITLFRANNTFSLEQAKSAMREQIRHLPNRVSPIGTPQKILRYEFPCEPIHLLSWLHNNHGIANQIYWSDRNDSFEMAGLGLTDTIQGKGAIDHKALFEYFDDRLSTDNPNLRYYGGLCFSDGSLDSQWNQFGSFRFVIPQFELFHSNGEIAFACNISMKDIHAKNIDTILKMLDKIDFSLETSYRNVPEICSREDVPDHETWRKIIAEIMHQPRNLPCEKIVLARKSVFGFNVSIRPSALMKHLKDQTPDCYHFCFQFSDHLAFLGATPERLYKRKGYNIESEAIAGTIQRGDNQEEERKLEWALLNSEKYKLEHKYVVDGINASLNKICASLEYDRNFGLLKLKEGQHLVTRFQGTLQLKSFDEQIIKALHPTPAVAGYPVEDAIMAIEQLEPFKRGWYAGPVGYVGPDTVEFAVAIRSGLVNENKLFLYAGAGIVDGSSADEEWNEIESKISRFIKVFEKRSADARSREMEI